MKLEDAKAYHQNDGFLICSKFDSDNCVFISKDDIIKLYKEVI